MRKLIGFIGSVIVTTAAFAQTSGTFDGSWTVTWEGKAQVYEAKLKLAGTSGTWRTAARDKKNPCVGQDVPVRVEASSASQASLILAFSEAIPGCKDSAVKLNIGADGSVTGTRGQAALLLKRE